MATETKTKIVSQAIGRRREAIASVRLIGGSSEMVVNGKAVSVYFPGLEAKNRYELPLKIVDLSSKYTATAMVHGGGKEGQLDALVLGLARALSDLKKEYIKPLRDAGLLTRDSRTRQRRMVGMGGKSRRHKQSPKR
jgi:small subunit ribosomal protein S9